MLISNARLSVSTLGPRALLPICVAALLLPAAPPQAGELVEVPGRAWERQFGDDVSDHYATAIALSRDGSRLWMGGTTRTGPRDAQRAQFWIWQLDPSGRVVSRMPLVGPGGMDGIDGAYPYVRGLTRRAGGGIYAVVEFEKGQPTVITLSEEGKPLNTRPIARTYGGAAIHKVLETADGGLYTVGEAGRGGFVARLEPGGKTLWEKRFPKGERLILLDATEDEDGGVVVIGNYGTFNEFGVGPANLWMARLNAQGAIRREVAWPGRTGSVGTRKDGGFLVVYDKSESAAQDVRLRVVNRELASERDEPLVKSDLGFARFRIVRLDDDNFVVAGSRQTTLWFAGVTSSGEVAWSYTGGPGGLWTTDALVSDGRNVYLLSSVMSVSKGKQRRELSRDIGLLRFAP